MKYVEAMYLPEGPKEPPAQEVLTGVFKTTAMREAIDSAADTLNEASPAAEDLSTSLQRLMEAAERLLDEVDEHECYSEVDCDFDDERILFVPVGQATPVEEQLNRASFLRGEETAIVKLSDLKALIEAAGVTARAQ